MSAWARTALGFVADARQAELLDSGARWLLLCCSRQWGKSTVTAIRVVHHVSFQPGAMVVVAGPAERQSGELLAKVAGGGGAVASCGDGASADFVGEFADIDGDSGVADSGGAGEL